MIPATDFQSDIRINVDGEWFYCDMRMTRRDILAFFHQNLRADENGRYFIETGGRRCPVDVEDTAYVVWSLRGHRDDPAMEERILILLSDFTMEELQPETLRIGKSNIPYCRVKEGRFEARFSRSGYYRLAELLHYDSANDTSFLLLNGRRFNLLQELHGSV